MTSSAFSSNSSSCRASGYTRIFTLQPCSRYFMHAARTPAPYSPTGSIEPDRKSIGRSVGVFSIMLREFAHISAFSRSLNPATVNVKLHSGSAM